MDAPVGQSEFKKFMDSKYIVKDTDMSADMQIEVPDIIASGVDNSMGPNGLIYENASKYIKEALDKRYGSTWHVVIGEGYAVDVTMQKSSMMLLFYKGTLAILVFKS